MWQSLSIAVLIVSKGCVRDARERITQLFRTAVIPQLAPGNDRMSDSTHGDIAEFELVTVRVRDAAGAAGLG